MKEFIPYEPQIIINSSSPLDYIRAFLNDEILLFLHKQTNKEVKKKKEKEMNIKELRYIKITEIRMFIGLTIFMGIKKIPNFKRYWFTPAGVDNYLEESFIKEKMTHARYCEIRRYFRMTVFEPVETSNSSKIIKKTENIISAINKLFFAYYAPGREISIDETIYPFQGRVHVKTYNKDKPHPWGLKFYAAANSKTGYVFALKFYNGEKSTLENTVMTLLTNIRHKNHEVYMDNFYNSYEISLKLLESGVYVTGTLRKKRGGPKVMNVITKKTIPKKPLLPFKKGAVNVFIFNDKKIFTMISTSQSIIQGEVAEAKQIKIQDRLYSPLIINPSTTTSIIKNYNYYMGGVDVHDQLLQTYTCRRQTTRWTFNFSIHLIETIILNSYILYKKNNGNNTLDHLDYQILVVNFLCGKVFKQPKSIETKIPISLDGGSSVPEISNIGTLNSTCDIIVGSELQLSNSHTPIVSKKYRRCIYCSSNQGRDSHTNVMCKECNRGLCLNTSGRMCWFLYHDSFDKGNSESSE